MSHYHHECSNAIRTLLAKVPTGLTRAQIYEGIAFFGKNEKIFGACFSAMCGAGDLAALREPLKPTLYTLIGNAPTPARSIAERPRAQHGKIQERTARILAILRETSTPMTLRSIWGHLENVSEATISHDLAALALAGTVQRIPGSGRTAALYCLPRGAEAHDAEPSSAPAISPAQSAADLLDWQQMDNRLELAFKSAKDVRTAYITATVDSKLLTQMDATVKATEEALQIHRQRRPA